MRHWHRETAFTLIELMVVVAITAILAMIAGPSISGFRDKYRLTQVANDYAMTINLVRVQSITENRTLSVYHYPDTAYNDGTRVTRCVWDVKAFNPDMAPPQWETIPFEETADACGSLNYDLVDPDSGPFCWNATGLYNYSEEGSPKHIPYISMIGDQGGITEGTVVSFNTRGTVDVTEAETEPGCYKRVAFQNKANNEMSRMSVCIETSGVAKLMN